MDISSWIHPNILIRTVVCSKFLRLPLLPLGSVFLLILFFSVMLPFFSPTYLVISVCSYLGIKNELDGASFP